MTTQQRKQQLKCFTREQVETKIRDRANVPTYRSLLMQCKVSENEKGIHFDLKHPSWKVLVQTCKDADRAAKPRNGTGGTPDRRAPPAVLRVETVESTPRSVHRPSPRAYQSPVDKNAVKPHRKSSRSKRQHSKEDWHEQLTDTLSSNAPSKKLVRQACKQIGVRGSLRGKIWGAMLDSTPGCARHKEAVLLSDDIPVLRNQRVIDVDLDRTRPTLPRFQSSRVKKEMRVILAHYCHRHKCSYKQGMNYVLAPFFLVNPDKDYDRTLVYLQFEAFIQRFLTATFMDDEFGALQCIFRLFAMALQYHDPELKLHLDRNDMTPELYTSGWFMTIHAHKSPEDVIYTMWDELIIGLAQEGEIEPRFHYFISLALVMQNKPEVMHRATEEIPEFLSKITIQDSETAQRLIRDARKMIAQTPITFYKLLHHCTSKNVRVDSQMYNECDVMKCIQVGPDELISCSYAEVITGGKKRRKKRKESAKIKFFVLDCRPSDQYEKGHLPLAVNLDPALPLDALNEKMKSILHMKGSHFVIFFDGSDESDRNLRMFQQHLHYLLNQRCKYVSLCPEGYAGCYSKLQELGLLEHVDWRPVQRRGFLQSVKGRIGQMMAQGMTEQRPGAQLPRTIRLLSRTNEIHLLHTVLRNQKTTQQKFRSATHRLVHILVAEALESMVMVEAPVTTTIQEIYHGVNSERAIYGVALSDAAETALRLALEVFNPVCRSLVGKITVELEHKNDENGILRTNRSAVAYIPKDIEQRMVLLFQPTMFKSKLHSPLEALVRLKARPANIVVLSLVASRDAMLSIAEKYPEVRIICSAIDGVNGGRIVPGYGNFDTRYNMKPRTPVT